MQGSDHGAHIPHLSSDLKRLACQIGSLPAVSVHFLSQFVSHRLKERPYPHSFASHCLKAAEQDASSPQIASDEFSWLTTIDRNLMAPDSFKNLGFGDNSDDPKAVSVTATPSTQPSQSQNQDKPRGP
jgi:hypothetical protein